MIHYLSEEELTQVQPGTFLGTASGHVIEIIRSWEVRITQPLIYGLLGFFRDGSPVWPSQPESYYIVDKPADWPIISEHTRYINSLLTLLDDVRTHFKNCPPEVTDSLYLTRTVNLEASITDTLEAAKVRGYTWRL